MRSERLCNNDVIPDVERWCRGRGRDWCCLWSSGGRETRGWSRSVDVNLLSLVGGWLGEVYKVLFSLPDDFFLATSLFLFSFTAFLFCVLFGSVLCSFTVLSCLVLFCVVWFPLLLVCLFVYFSCLSVPALLLGVALPELLCFFCIMPCSCSVAVLAFLVLRCSLRVIVLALPYLHCCLRVVVLVSELLLLRWYACSAVLVLLFLYCSLSLLFTAFFFPHCYPYLAIYT